MPYTVPDILIRAAIKHAAKVALIDGSRRVTYSQLLDRVQVLSGALRAAGVEKGDRVGVYLRRSIDAVAALFATWFTGGVAVVLHDSLRTRQAQYILDHSEARCLVSDARQLAYAPGLRFPAASTIDVAKELPRTSTGAPARVVGADLALIIYTSGSTGLPKGVMLSHAGLVAGTEIVADYVELSSDDVTISVLPFSFDYGLNQLLTSVFTGGTLVIQRSLFPWNICNTLMRERVTGMAGVPTLWLQLSQSHSPFPTATLPDLRYITNSGGSLPVAVVRAIRQWHPHLDVYLMYGLTEAFRSTYLPPHEVDRHPGSIGQAIPNTEILVIGEDGRPCAHGEIGELVHRGPTVALGYWRDPQSTARVFRPHPSADATRPAETVVFSGDLVRAGADGYLYYVGRRDQLIKSNGFRLSPDEIESCIFASGLVANVAAFAVPRDETQVEIVAAVVPKTPQAFDEEALRRFCRVEMPEYLRPHAIWRLEALPLTSSGKPDRPRLRQEYVPSGRPGIPARTAGTV